MEGGPAAPGAERNDGLQRTGQSSVAAKPEACGAYKNLPPQNLAQGFNQNEFATPKLSYNSTITPLDSNSASAASASATDTRNVTPTCSADTSRVSSMEVPPCVNATEEVGGATASMPLPLSALQQQQQKQQPMFFRNRSQSMSSHMKRSTSNSHISFPAAQISARVPQNGILGNGNVTIQSILNDKAALKAENERLQTELKSSLASVEFLRGEIGKKADEAEFLNSKFTNLTVKLKNELTQKEAEARHSRGFLQKQLDESESKNKRMLQDMEKFKKKVEDETCKYAEETRKSTSLQRRIREFENVMESKDKTLKRVQEDLKKVEKQRVVNAIKLASERTSQQQGKDTKTENETLKRTNAMLKKKIKESIPSEKAHLDDFRKKAISFGIFS